MVYQLKPIAGIHILSLALNLPGPLALARLCQLGAAGVKVEPPDGDPLSHACTQWYEALISGVEVMRLDLKSTAGKEQLDDLLAENDLLLTSSRPAALERLGLGWPLLSRRFPRLLQVAIVGDKPPNENKPGHDLTYQAVYGLVNPPQMPMTLVADLAGAEQAVWAALSLLLARERSRDLDSGSRIALVSLREAAADFAKPLKYGLTGSNKLLGGLLPGYNLYQAKEGWVAVGALEHHFLRDLAGSMGLTDLDREALAAIFLSRPAVEWEAWAEERDLPIVAVKQDA